MFVNNPRGRGCDVCNRKQLTCWSKVSTALDAPRCLTAHCRVRAVANSTLTNIRRVNHRTPAKRSRYHNRAGSSICNKQTTQITLDLYDIHIGIGELIIYTNVLAGTL